MHAPRSGSGAAAGQEEKRAAHRRRVLKSAQVVYNNGNSVLDCSVQDLSEMGARLHLSSAVILPDEFRLFLADGRKVPVEVVWRAGRAMGVRFADRQPDGTAGVAPGRVASTAMILARLAEIEALVSELRRELAARLRD